MIAGGAPVQDTRTVRRESRRRTIAAGAVVLVTAGLMAAGSGVAWATETAFAECAVNKPNVGCQFAGAVAYGSHVVVYNYKRTSGGYDKEIRPGFCPRDPCPLFSSAVPDPNRIPANFEITADGPVAIQYP